MDEADTSGVSTLASIFAIAPQSRPTEMLVFSGTWICSSCTTSFVIKLDKNEVKRTTPISCSGGQLESIRGTS